MLLRTKFRGQEANGTNIAFSGSAWQYLDPSGQSNFHGGDDSAYWLAYCMRELLGASLSFTSHVIDVDTAIVNITALEIGEVFNAYGLSTTAPTRMELSGPTLTGGADGVIAAFLMEMSDEVTAGQIFQVRKGMGEYQDVFAIDGDGRITTGGHKASQVSEDNFLGSMGVSIHNGIIYDIYQVN
jgi:hypothetical protein